MRWGRAICARWLDGGVEARPGNVRLAVTSNRRAIVHREASEQDDPLNPRDAVDDQLALADRFGLSLGFHACSQDEYLAIVRGYAEEHRPRLDRSRSARMGQAARLALGTRRLALRHRAGRASGAGAHAESRLAGREPSELPGLHALGHFLERAPRIAAQLALRRHARAAEPRLRRRPAGRRAR